MILLREIVRFEVLRYRFILDRLVSVQQGMVDLFTDVHSANPCQPAASNCVIV